MLKTLSSEESLGPEPCFHPALGFSDTSQFSEILNLNSFSRETTPV